MEIIINPEKKDTILLSDVDPSKHIVVGIDPENRPLLFCQTQLDIWEETTRAIVVQDSNGLFYGFDKCNSIEKLISMDKKTHKMVKKLAAFPKADWKEAFKWLIDNA